MDAATIIAVLAVVVAAGSLATSILVAWFRHKWDIRPALIFTYDRSAGWALRNAGNGAALDAVVAVGGANEVWRDPVRIPPLAKDHSVPLPWLQHGNWKLGCTCQDLAGRPYSSLCEEDITTFCNGRILPIWREEDIQRYWTKSRSPSP